MFHTRVLPFLLLVALSAASHAVPISFKSCISLCGSTSMSKGSVATTSAMPNYTNQVGGIHFSVHNHSSSLIGFSKPSPVLSQLFLHVGNAASKSFDPNQLRSLRIKRPSTNAGWPFNKRTNLATKKAGGNRLTSGKNFKIGAAIPVPEPSSMLLTAAGLLGLRIFRYNGGKV